jgi:phosphomannomutase
VRPSGTEPIVRLFAEAASEVEAGSRVAEAEREADAVRG